MSMMRLGPVEQRFAELIWENAPISSGELVKLCQKELQWKKPTTYTVLRKLCERGLFQNTDSCVTVLISQEEYMGLQSQQFIEETFSGSLPAFLAAFTSRKKLTAKEIKELKRMVENYEEE